MVLSADTSPGQRYAERAARLGESARVVQRRMRRLANARLTVFVVAVAALLFTRGNSPLFWAVVIAGGGVFTALVVRHRAARAQLRDLHARIELCRIGVSRLRREWELIPVTLHDGGAADHPYAGDLDLFGRPALTQLCGQVFTLHGKRTLRAWLLNGAEPAIIGERQHAARVLAADIEFRESFAVAAQLTVGRGQERLDQFIRWVGDTKLPRVSPLTIWIARVLPILTFVLIAAQVSDITDRAWWLLPLVASTIFSGFTLKRCYRTFDAAFSRDPAPLSYSRVFQLAQQAPRDGALLERIHQRLHTHGASAAERIRRLEQIMLYADVRHSGTASVLLELFFQWSFHIWLALRSWQEAARADLSGWFDALGELEALCSLATLAHDQPRWCFPVVDSSATAIQATQSGHPMLEGTSRVLNDVALGPPGSFLFITGSNMSGKSTLLRALGVNTVLAQAGAPVCAQHYHTPPLRLYTSINVRDSLADGVSLYMAQLRRIKTIIDAAEADSSVLCCYLLDEILSGTNSTDRTTAVRGIVHHLLASRAIGALATHDLALAADATIRAAGQSIHFTETVDAQTSAMTFDYRIRPGVVQTSNALALMRLLGISLEP